MKPTIETIILISAFIFIFTGGYFIGSYLQFNKDANLINTYEENGTIPDTSCIPVDCISPYPRRNIDFSVEELTAVTIKREDCHSTDNT